jgi:regulatory protein
VPPSGRRPSGPSLPGDRTGGAAFRRDGEGDGIGDVHDGVRAWLANAGIEIPVDPAEPSATPVDPVSAGPGADQEAVARKILLDQLTGQARTRSELAAKLARKGVPGDLAARLLDRFEEVGLVDDEAFARSWVQSRQPGKGLARRALAQELRRKGVDDEVARVALDEVDPDDEVEAARTLVRRKLRTVARLDRDVAVRRLTGMLARKGYPAGICFRVVREELAALGHDTDDVHETFE